MNRRDLGRGIGRAMGIVGAFVPMLWPAIAGAQAQPPVPAVVLTHMQELDARCRAAGGQPGNGKYIVAQDFTGDGRLDYLLSEGNYDCTGRPDAFRSNGEARVDIFVTDAANQARRLYSDVLIGYRVLAGKPVKVQIARQGKPCGANASASTKCAAQLVWNGQGFGEGVSVRDDGAASAAPAPAPAAPAPASVPAGGFSVPASARADFLKRCRADYVRAEASAARWADEQCLSDWAKVVAAGPAAEAILAVLPAQGERPALATVKQRASAVRWSARPQTGAGASGTLGDLDVTVQGSPAPSELSVGWMKVGAEIPYDVANALRVRGVTVEQVACEKTGTGEGSRIYAGTAPGRAPFALSIDQRTAPTGNANSYYAATVKLDGRHPPRGPTSGCDF